MSIPVLIMVCAWKRYRHFTIIWMASWAEEGLWRGSKQIDAIKMVPLITLIACNHGPVIIGLPANAIENTAISQ